MTSSHQTLFGRRGFAVCALGAALALSGCATSPSTAMAREASLPANEGIVVLRLVNLGAMPIYNITVRAENDSQTYTLNGTHFGQTTALTIVGRLPAGRYQPIEMLGRGAEGLAVVTTKSPLTGLTGKFDVEAARVSDLGTMIYAPAGTISDSLGTLSLRSFTLPLDPTPVASDKLLTARFPAFAAAVNGRSVLGWVPGTVPTQRADLLKNQRLGMYATTPPAWIGDAHSLSGGALGTVVERRGKAPPVTHSTGSVHHLEAVLVLRDGRWLVGGEEGHVAVSDNAGARWQRIPGAGAGESVLHLSQLPDGRLHMVTTSDNGNTVYASAASPIEWKALRTIESGRVPKSKSGGGLTPGEFAGRANEGPIERDAAASTDERLVVYTEPSTLTTLDYRSGAWETQKTPHHFRAGMKTTRDGYVVGVLGFSVLSGSLDYGKTWSRLDGFIHMSMPEFVDRKRGFLIAAENKLTGIGEFKLQRTEDGGKSWKPAEARSSGHWLGHRPLWVAADGKTFYSLQAGLVTRSVDQARTWD